MKLLPFAQLVEDAGLGALASSVFVEAMPAQCLEATLLRNDLTGDEIDYELPGYYKTGFQLIVRSHSYEDGLQRVSDAVKALTVRNQNVGTYYVIYSRPKTKPVSYPVSKGNLIEFMVQFGVVFVDEEE